VLHLNKSGSSVVDFTNLSSHNHKESSFDPILSTDQKLKPRKHTKAPSKRLALLLDAYSERNPRKQNLTMENLEVSSRENSSLRSPKNIRNSTEITKKPLGLKQTESAANLKSFDALKSIEITKIVAYQELLRNNAKSQRHESESIQRQIQGRQDAQVGARTQNEESSLMKQLEKKQDKSLGKKRNDVSAKRAALRKTKVLQSDMSVPLLNNTQPHSTKHQQQQQANVVSTSLNFSNYTNSAVSLLNKIMANQEKSKKTSTTSISSQVRSPSNIRQTEQKVQHGNYFSTSSITTTAVAPRKEEKSGSATRKIDDLKKSGVKLGISLPIKDIQLGHHNKGISMITTKHNTETDRELLTHTSQEPPLTSIQSAKKRNSPTAREILLSFSNKKPASTLTKLEKAFDLFLEENRQSLGQQKIDKIAQAWSLFTETVKTIEGHGNRQESSSRKEREGGLKKSAQSVSTNYTEKKGKEDLTSLIDKQQQQIEAMKKKEDNMLQMILNIKSKAAEIEKDHQETIVSLQAEDDSILSQSMDLMSSNPNYLGLPTYKSSSDAKSTTDNTPYPLILGQKNVPKLDLTTISTNNNSNKITSNGGMGSGNGSKGFKLDLKGISAENATAEDRPGFHEEFMAKIDEFSHSWRQEALNQRDYIDD